MPTKKDRGSTRKQQPPRRTHNLGGCYTCRKRHVKCDRNRPQCTTCSSAGLQCGGFPSQIRWASMVHGPGKTSSRPCTPPTQNHCEPTLVRALSKEPPSTSDRPPQLSNDVVVHHGDTDVDGASIPMPGETNEPLEIPNVSNPVADTTSLALGTDGFDTTFHDEFEAGGHPSTGSISDLESLLETSSGLGWGDLFASSWDFSMMPIQNYADPLSMLAHVANQLPGTTHDPQQYLYSMPPDQFTSMLNMGPPPYTLLDLEESQALEDGKILLKHFRDVVIPQFAPLPMSTKSPWEKLVWTSAVQTHAELTYLGSTTAKHASKANLFAVLGCSAHSIAKTGSFPGVLSAEKAAQILEYASARAKRHMQESLKTETGGSSKAKYKDQLMAILSLVALATLGGHQTDARCYLIDAERLLRLRGLAKRVFSSRIRALHHVYTWLRIIGESTFALRDHTGPQLKTRIEKIFSHLRASHQAQDISEGQDAVENSSQLDDFLRIAAHNSDSDSDLDASKDREVGLRDIHLEDLRPDPATMYMDIYGIPEEWLSLVSQTTRLANIMDFIEQTSVQPPRAFASAIQRKIIKLEQMVFSFSVQHCHKGSTTPSQTQNSIEHAAKSGKRGSAGKAMLRAMGSALVIFFNRRIRKSLSWMLQGHVDDVIAALQNFDDAQDPGAVKTPGTPWPAFIAGCEATSQSSRDWLMRWLQKGESQSAFNGFSSSQWAMKEVWKSRDGGDAGAVDIDNAIKNTSISRSQFSQTYSWVEVLQQHKFWLMIY